MGRVSGATARFVGVGFVLGEVPICWDVTSALFLQSIFDNDFVLPAPFPFKKWESGLHYGKSQMPLSPDLGY